MSEDHTQEIIQDVLLMRIFIPKMGEVKGGWRNLPSEERRKIFLSKSVIRMIE
jgi:hypothetical protein